MMHTTLARIVFTSITFLSGLLVVGVAQADANLPAGADRAPTYQDIQQQKQAIAQLKKQLWREKQSLRKLKKASLELETDIKLLDSAEADYMRKAIEGQLQTTQNVSKQFILQSLSPLVTSPAQYFIDKDLANRLIAQARSEQVLSPQAITQTYDILMQSLSFRSHIFKVPALEQKDIFSIGGLYFIGKSGQFKHEADGVFVPYAATATQNEQQRFKDFIEQTHPYVTLPLDINGGQVYQTRADQPSFQERFSQAGMVGKVIAAIGVLGFMIFVFRMIYLYYATFKVKWQIKHMEELKTSNAVGRILKHASNEKLPLTTDTVELTVAPFMLAEIPKIEFLNSSLKLMAGISPLLGLLGTVAGMVITFHGISLGGGADASVMAEGIERALMTTVFGLCVAIPLLIGHSLVASKAKTLVSMIESETLNYLADKFINRQTSQHEQ